MPTNSTIYVSSKHIHVQLWRHYRHRGHNIISSWIDLDEILDLETVGRKYWPIWLGEAYASDFLIFYAVPSDTNHNSCLLEIASCLQGGGTILHVGVSEAMKTYDGEMADFTYHPRWKRIANLDKAFETIASYEDEASKYLEADPKISWKDALSLVV